MRKSTVDFVWQELSSDQELPAAPMSASQATDSRQARVRRRVALVFGPICLLLLALVSAAWVRQQAETSLAEIQNELILAADDEGRHGGNGQAQGPAPTVGLWGQPQFLTTEHFDITYYSRDAQTVEAVAGELDALYETVRRNLGLPSAPRQRIAIEVAVGETAANLRLVKKSHNHILVASPAFLRTPAWLSHADILRQSILVELVDKGVKEAISTQRVPPRWYPLLTSMRIWQLWDLGGPLTAWRNPVLRRFYTDIQHIDGDIASLLPKAYTELCPLYTEWTGETWLSSLCPERDEAETLNAGNWETLQFTDFVHIPIDRFMFAPARVPDDGQGYTHDHYEWILWVALLDYIAETFGRDRIGELWPILHEHKEWETLIPALFDMPKDEFEAGWQAYLAAPGDP